MAELGGAFGYLKNLPAPDHPLLNAPVQTCYQPTTIPLTFTEYVAVQFQNFQQQTNEILSFCNLHKVIDDAHAVWELRRLLRQEYTDYLIGMHGECSRAGVMKAVQKIDTPMHSPPEWCDKTGIETSNSPTSAAETFNLFIEMLVNAVQTNPLMSLLAIGVLMILIKR